MCVLGTSDTQTMHSTILQAEAVEVTEVTAVVVADMCLVSYFAPVAINFFIYLHISILKAFLLSKKMI